MDETHSGERRTLPDDAETDSLFSSAQFFALDRWFDESLSQLVARWSHLAAPQATRTSAPRLRGGMSVRSKDAGAGA